MEETKETKNLEETKELKQKVKKEPGAKKGKHKAKATIGDIVFRTLILVSIFFIAVIAYVYLIEGNL